MKRNLAQRLELLLQQFPVVSILGARQVGKTTLAKQLHPNWQYFDLQKPAIQTMILRDPELFFQNHPHSIILDEAQTHPILFDVLRGVIDENRSLKGRFIITGSSSPELLTNLSESLAGRIGRVELGTLKANEIANAPISDFYDWFQINFATLDPKELQIKTPSLQQNDINRSWFYGGYPEIVLSQSDMEQQNWFEAYEQTYLYRDITSLFPNINKNNFQRFFHVLAHLSGTILNKSNCARDLEISQNSVQNYLNIISGTFIWQNINSFEHTNYKSLIKMPKGYFADSGLLHYLTRMINIDFLRQHFLVGRSFEGFVINEIIKGLRTKSIGKWDAYYFRTQHGAEIDLILNGRFGLLPIEIKYGILVTNRDLMSLSSFIKDNNLKFGVVINQAPNIEWLTPHILQLPVFYI